MADIRYFTPNRETHLKFAEALVKAESAGVKVLAYDCEVTENTMSIRESVEVRLIL